MPDAEDFGRLTFVRVLERSQNVTHHLWSTPNGRANLTRMHEILGGIEAQTTGNRQSYEDHVFAYNISSDVSDTVRQQIEATFLVGDDEGLWEWEISSTPSLSLERA